MAKHKSHGFLSELFGEETTHHKKHKAASHAGNHAGRAHVKVASVHAACPEGGAKHHSPKSKARAEAGRKGGLAPHRCRGRGCSE